jgi:1-acyl-sn-glycerol-3-phosphate acyltransferase
MLDSKKYIVISNHQLLIDWILIWCLLDKIGKANNIVIILKEDLKNSPLVGKVRKISGVYLGDAMDELYLS